MCLISAGIKFSLSSERYSSSVRIIEDEINKVLIIIILLIIYIEYNSRQTIHMH